MSDERESAPPARPGSDAESAGPRDPNAESGSPPATADEAGNDAEIAAEPQPETAGEPEAAPEPPVPEATEASDATETVPEPVTTAEAAPPETAETSEPAVQSAAPATPAPEPEPATPAPVAKEPAPVAEEPTPPAEQVEWRPVVTGEQIEWQPVLRSEADAEADAEAEAAADATADERYDDAVEDWPEEGWEEPVAARRTRAVAGNGAPRRPRSTAGTRPPSRPPRQPADGPPKPPPNQRRQVILLSILTGVVVIVAVLGVVLSRGAQQTGSDATAPPTTGRTSGTGTTVPATELTTFRDDVTGFTIRYPRSWNRLVPPIADIRLVLIAGENDALQVRILPIQTPATTQNIANFKAVTDAIVFGDMSNKLVQEQLVTLNGKLTYYYLYTFNDQATGQQGVHAHYFVFEGHRMYSMVFQALPAEDFPRLAAVYDQVAESFNVPPEQPGTTAAPPTTR